MASQKIFWILKTPVSYLTISAWTAHYSYWQITLNYVWFVKAQWQNEVHDLFPNLDINLIFGCGFLNNILILWEAKSLTLPVQWCSVFVVSIPSTFPLLVPLFILKVQKFWHLKSSSLLLVHCMKAVKTQSLELLESGSLFYWVYHILFVWLWASYLSLTQLPHLYNGVIETYVTLHICKNETN